MSEGPKICGACNENIPNHWVIGLDKFWHQDCFCCGVCGRVVDAKETFYEKDGKPVCHRCQTKNFVEKCGVCQEPIIGNRMIYKDIHYHYTCLNCKKCGQPFKEEQHDQIKILENGDFVHDNC
ncbi:hypothetical protein ACHWQZ_G015600 [Mnemiopsis leidyi]|uniref:Unclassified LIM protein ML06737a n=1 Tax=Mnemiopsis leidyi TaxID=27923 RepID=H2DJY4_MNELE|nr:unclassified LIM protein ML06737a [Mnemiopsis leidyi]